MNTKDSFAHVVPELTVLVYEGESELKQRQNGGGAILEVTLKTARGVPTIFRSFVFADKLNELFK